jgi:pyridoxamine 5'-phosphate oxidase family protein
MSIAFFGIKTASIPSTPITTMTMIEGFDGEYFYVGGINILKSRKYKNVLKNNKVALVIDDLKVIALRNQSY